MDAGVYSYLSAALGFGFLTVLLLISWRSSVQGRLLTFAILSSAVWAALAATVAASGNTGTGAYQALEVLRSVAWFVFLLKLLEPAAGRNPAYRRFLRWALPLSVGFGVLLLVAEWLTSALLVPLPLGVMSARLSGHVFLAIIGLSIIEQLYRNTSASHRWAIKYLFIGAGGIFAFDLYLYADALLFRGIDRQLWEARGFVNLAAVPLLAVTAARNRDWSINIFVSRDIVLYTTAILGGGLYLLVMAGAGYYLREYGGDWSELARTLFFSLAIVLLAVVLFSGQLRARMRVFLGKHFYTNKYDYRHEWLRLTGALDATVHDREHLESAIRVMAQPVEARAGLLWLADGRGHYENTATWNADQVSELEPSDSGLIRFLTDKAYVINLRELDLRPGEYEGLDLPAWLDGVPRGWLIVPLFGLHALMGFVVLANPLVKRSINWEDRDLLLTAARQVAGHLAVLQTSEALAQARQFEVFNRLSAYMVHDLKNIAAELEMVARNADKHKANPEFVDDALETVAEASRDIQRLLDQLRGKRVPVEKKVLIDLGALVKEVVAGKQQQAPAPRLASAGQACQVIAEKGRLENVLTHLIENAQQATPQDGMIEVKVYNRDSTGVVEIRDNGQGMTADFIRHRLFKPFDTTKGNAGMGIGMYESREFIRQLGGDIRVESEAGKGTCIAIDIPVSNAREAWQRDSA